MTSPWADCPHDLHPTLARMARRHGAPLNVVANPPGRCAACNGHGPTSVHPLVLVWLRCRHTRDLPALKIDLAIDHSKRLHYQGRPRGVAVAS